MLTTAIRRKLAALDRRTLPPARRRALDRLIGPRHEQFGEPAKLPTLASDAGNRRLDSQIVDAMAKHKMFLPANFSFDTPGAVDVFLAILKTANLARQKREAAEAAEPPPDTTAATDDPDDGFATTGRGQQFSEGGRRRRGRVTRMSPGQAKRFSDATQRPHWSPR